MPIALTGPKARLVVAATVAAALLIVAAVVATLALAQDRFLLAAVVVGLVAIAAAGCWLLAQRLLRPLRRLAAETQIVANANPSHRVTGDDSAEVGELAAAIDALAQRYRSATVAMEPRIREAIAAAEEEKQRLAALVAQLSQSIVVCNAAGRVILYNESARRLLSGTGARHRSDRGEPLGLDRTIFAFVDQQLIGHALEHIRLQRSRNRDDVGSTFVTTSPDDRLIRVRVAPLYPWSSAADAPESPAEGEAATLGFVLTLDDVTGPLEAAQRADTILQSLTGEGRASTANIRTAVETLIEIPDLDARQRAQLVGIIHDETAVLSERLERAESEYSATLKSQWSLETMRAADLASAAARRMEGKLAIAVEVELADEGTWLRAEGFAIVQALSYLASRLKYELDVSKVTLRVGRADRLAFLDVAWNGASIALATWQQWESQPLRLGGEASPLSLTAVLDRHGGQAWYQAGREGGALPYVRLLLPAVSSGPDDIADTSRGASFDLRAGAQAPDLLMRRLDALACTAFAADVSSGEGIGERLVAIAATRIVNGRLLEREAMETGAEPIERALQRFGRFCGNTVLVTHDAPRVMPLMRALEASTGTRFAQPVLDTLTLATLAQLPVSTLADAARRVGLEVHDDAATPERAKLVAKLALKLFPLVEARGLATLGAVLAAGGRAH